MQFEVAEQHFAACHEATADKVRPGPASLGRPASRKTSMSRNIPHSLSQLNYSALRRHRTPSWSAADTCKRIRRVPAGAVASASGAPHISGTHGNVATGLA